MASGRERTWATSVALGPGAAYLVGRDTPFQLVNTADPEAPWLEASLPLPTQAWSVELEGPYAYVAADTTGLLRIDISDPEQLTISAVYDTPERALGVAVSGSYAFVANELGQEELGEPDRRHEVDVDVGTFHPLEESANLFLSLFSQDFTETADHAEFVPPGCRIGKQTAYSFDNDF